MTETAVDPYAEYKDDEIPSDKLDLLANLAEGWKHAQEDVVAFANLLAKAQARVKEIEEKEIPEIMDDLELEKFTTRSGLAIEVGEIIRCSVPKEKKPAAIAWLCKNGHQALVKRTLSVNFAKGEYEKADAFSKLIDRDEYELSDKEDVHHQTMLAWVKEKLEAGEDLPSDLFPVFRQRVAKIK